MQTTRQERGRNARLPAAVPARMVLTTVLALGLGAPGCERRSTRLIEISDVTRDDDSQALSVTGSGFPTSTVGEAELTGTLYRPGESPRALHRTMPCHALSDELLRLDPGSTDGDHLAGGLFEGRLQVYFPAFAGESQVSGAIGNLRIRFEAAAKPDLSADLLLSRRARTFQRELGALEVEGSSRGLVVLRIAEDSHLARAGVHPGDRIERLDGAPVERAQDLLPAQENPRHTILLGRHAGGRGEQIELTIAAPESAVAGSLATMAFLVALLGFALLPPSPPRSAPRATPTDRALSIALTGLSFAACAAAGDALALSLFVGLPLLASLSVLGIAFARHRMDSVAALHGVLQLSATTLALAGLAILSGSLTVAWHGPSALAAPTHWPLLTAPPTWLSLGVLVVALPAPHAERGPRWVQGWLSLSATMGFVTLATGAGVVPVGAPAWAATAPCATLIVVAKTALLSAILAAPRAAPPMLLVAAGALSCPLAAWAWLTLAPDAHSTIVLSALGLGAWFARAVRHQLTDRRGLQRDPSLSPFL